MNAVTWPISELFNFNTNLNSKNQKVGSWILNVERKK